MNEINHTTLKFLKSVNKTKEPLSVIIGNFDGVHLGHQVILKEFISFSQSINTKSVILTFNPHPLFIINGTSPMLITDYEKKYELFNSLGVDDIAVLKFNQHIRDLSAHGFLDQLVELVPAIKAIYLGPDFSLGKDRELSKDEASDYLKSKGIETNDLKRKLKTEDDVISSTLIRESLQSSEFGRVQQMLGREFSFDGNVHHGFKIGGEIGFPTANIEVSEELLLPAIGVYAVRVSFQGKDHIGAMNIGKNPTVQDSEHLKVEVHLIDFQGDLYHQNLVITPLEKIRNEMKFSSLQELTNQINSDVQKIRERYMQ